MDRFLPNVPDWLAKIDFDYRNRHLIEHGKYVIMRLPNGMTRIAQVLEDRPFVIGKYGTCNGNDLIGKPFGLHYDILENNQITVVPHSEIVQEVDDVDVEPEEIISDNREIFDDGTSQKLSLEDIKQLRQEATNGKEIVSVLAENNKSFEKKSEYAKAKYIKRKNKKFLKRFSIEQPTAAKLCQHFYYCNPAKIRHMRIDVFSMILHLANPLFDSKLLVADETNGMLLGGLIERMGRGKIVAIHESELPFFDVLGSMNLPKQQLAMIENLSWRRLEAGDDEQRLEKKSETWQEKIAQFRNTRDLIKQVKFDGLIITSKVDLVSVLKRLIPSIAPSRPVVVYSPLLDTIKDAFVFMRSQGDFIDVEMRETWLREYQTLPQRMHPEMMTSAHGGYILTAIRVIPRRDENGTDQKEPDLDENGTKQNDEKEPHLDENGTELSDEEDEPNAKRQRIESNVTNAIKLE